MKLVTKEEYNNMLEKTSKWAKSHGMFGNSTGIASVAAAEFAFNQEGKTMYEHLAKE